MGGKEAGWSPVQKCYQNAQGLQIGGKTMAISGLRVGAG